MADIAKEPRVKRNKPRRKETEEEKLIDGPSPRDKTKAVFNQLLQQAVQESGNERKAGKKKKRHDDTLLEKIKKGEGLLKDEEDTVRLANTYDPDTDSKGKSNKQKELERKTKQSNRSNVGFTGKDNLAYEDEAVIEKKKKKKLNTEVISDLEPPAVAQDICNSIESLDVPRHPMPKPRKKKKKKTSEEEEPKQIGDNEAEIELQSEEQLSHDDNMEEAGNPTAKKKKKKKKRGAEVQEEAENEMEKARLIEDDGRVLGVQVHRTDKLKTDFYMSHPLVRISCLDLATGNYLKKQNPSRPVSSYYEQDNENVDFVLPIMTLPFDFKEKKSTLPVWEEIIVFNENFNYFQTDSPQVILFFELLDFLSMNTAKQKYNTQKQEGGWHRIAWAFLKVLGANGQPNTDKKVRLQLYQPPRLKVKPGQLEIFQWYEQRVKTSYPSTLYVTIKGITPPSEVQPATRSMFANQREQGGKTFDDLQDTINRATLRRTTTRRREPSAWNRLPGQVCKVPNEACLVLSGGRRGCYFLKFSPDGHYLACGCKENETYPIMVYEMPGGRLKHQFPGHYNIVYELSWSKDSKLLLSASSDGTAKIWNFEEANNTPEKVLPHPSFVYAAKFHNRMSKVVVTGGYDHVIRVWSTDNDLAILMQELDGHMSHVNSLCFDEEGAKMYSGDGLGHIIIWNVYVTDQPSKRGILKDWTKNKEIRDAEFKGVSINHLQMHPNNRRLLIHTRDNTIRLLDLRLDTVMQRYQGALNYREKMCCTVTPCGTFVITGSEDCNLYVWNTETGDQVAVFADLKYKTPVTCVDYHPHDHMMAMCAFGDNDPIIIYRYSHQVARMEAGIAEVSDSKKVGRPGSPRLWTVVQDVMNEKLENDRSKATMVAEDVMTRTLARMDRVTKKLDSVMAFGSLRTGTHSLGMTGGGQTSWGTTFDTAYYSQFENAAALAPGVFSPHATGSLLESMQKQQQLASQTDYMKQTQSGSWRPLFSTVGRPRAVSPGRMYGTPTISFNTTAEGKAQFQFQTSEGARHAMQQYYELHGVQTLPYEVVALYDYAAQRSDELSMHRGDVIKVLHKDNENWWMGELASGQQGFFPANYVAGDEETNDYITEEDESDQVHLEDNTSAKRRTHAITTKSGELKFVSGTEDSDLDDTPRKQAKGKKKKGSKLSMENELEMLPRSNRRKPKIRVGESEA